MEQRRTFYFLFSSCCTLWETMGTRKIWWLKMRDQDSSSQPHGPMTFSRKVCRIELLRQHGDGWREVSLCIQRTCRPFSKRFLLYRHQPWSKTQWWPVMAFLLCLSSTFPFMFSIIFTQTCDTGDFEVHKAEPWKPQSAGKRNPCSITVLFPFWTNGWGSENCTFFDGRGAAGASVRMEGHTSPGQASFWDPSQEESFLI